MSENVLSLECVAFAEDVASICDNCGGKIITDCLIRACGGMAYRCLEAKRTASGKERTEELYSSLKYANEAKMWLNICIERKIFPEAFCNRSQRRLASLCYRISKALKEAEEEYPRTLVRFPAVKTVINTRRLLLRTFRKSDMEAFVNICSDPLYSDLATVAANDAERACEVIKEAKKFYAVSRIGSEELIGCVGIFDDGKSGKRCRIELGILPSYRGCGYYIELIEAASEYAFSKMNMTAVSIYLSEDHTFLIPATLRAGFKEEGRFALYNPDGSAVTVFSKTK